MKINSYTIFDFETGGLDPKKNPMTELAMLSIKGDTLEEIDRFSLLVKPFDPALVYDDKALDVTGITVDMLLSQGVDIKEVRKRVEEHFEKVNIHKGPGYKAYLVGHNPGFDDGFLGQLQAYTKIDLSKYVMNSKNYAGGFNFTYLDTIIPAKMAYGDDETMENFKLGTVVDKAGIALTDAHRAMNDVIATKDLLIEFIKKLRSTGGDMSSADKYKYRTTFHF